MTREEMYIAIRAIRDGLSFDETGLTKNLKNLREWEELCSEIYCGYSIDLPNEMRAQNMIQKDELKIFRFKIFNDRIVVQQTINKNVLDNTERHYPTLKLSIILDAPYEGEVRRLYNLIRQILKQTKCCFELLAEVLQSRISYRLELI